MKSRNRARSRLFFDKPVAGSDGFTNNNKAGGWESPLAPYPIGAELVPARGSESFINSAVTGVQIYTARIRSEYVERLGIDTTWRVTGSDGKVFNVTSVTIDDNDYKWSMVGLAFGEFP